MESTWARLRDSPLSASPVRRRSPSSCPYPPTRTLWYCSQQLIGNRVSGQKLPTSVVSPHSPSPTVPQSQNVTDNLLPNRRNPCPTGRKRSYLSFPGPGWRHSAIASRYNRFAAPKLTNCCVSVRHSAELEGRRPCLTTRSVHMRPPDSAALNSPPISAGSSPRSGWRERSLVFAIAIPCPRERPDSLPTRPGLGTLHWMSLWHWCSFRLSLGWRRRRSVRAAWLIRWPLHRRTQRLQYEKCLIIGSGWSCLDDYNCSWSHWAATVSRWMIPM